jgi:hypothetical protein
MRRLTLAVVAVVFALFSAAVAFAIANPFSNWLGQGTVVSVLAMGSAKNTLSLDFSSPLHVDSSVIDFGPVSFQGTTPTAMVLNTGRTTNSHASILKTPRQAERDRLKALAAHLYGLQRISGTPKKLSHDQIGDATIDGASIKTSGGGFTAIRNYSKVKGSATITWTGTMDTGPHAGKKLKGTIKVKYAGNRN